MKITVFWVVMLCSLVDGCQSFRGTCSLQGRRRMGTTLSWKQQVPLKLWWLSARLHGVTSEKRVIFKLPLVVQPEASSPSPQKSTIDSFPEPFHTLITFLLAVHLNNVLCFSLYLGLFGDSLPLDFPAEVFKDVSFFPFIYCDTKQIIYSI